MLQPADEPAADHPVDLEASRGVVGDDRKHRPIQRFESASRTHLRWNDRRPRLGDRAQALGVAPGVAGDGIDDPADGGIELGASAALRDALKIGGCPVHFATVRYRSAA